MANSANRSRVSSPLLLHPHPGAAARRAAAGQPGVALEREEPEERLAFLPSFLPSQGSGWEKPFGRPGWAGAAALRSPRTVLRAALHKGAGAAGAGARRHCLRPARLGTERRGALRDGAAPRGRRVSAELWRGARRGWGALRGRTEPPHGHRWALAKPLVAGLAPAGPGCAWAGTRRSIAGISGQVPSEAAG